jgi:hypothetical protein
MILRWQPFVKQALCYKPIDHTIHPGRDLILPDGHTYDEFSDPMFALARHALKFADAYSATLHANPRLINPTV